MAEIRVNLHMARLGADPIYTALADGTRREIIAIVGDNPDGITTQGVLEELPRRSQDRDKWNFPTTMAGVSKHISVLFGIGVFDRVRQRQVLRYSLSELGLVVRESVDAIARSQAEINLRIWSLPERPSLEETSHKFN